HRLLRRSILDLNDQLLVAVAAKGCTRGTRGIFHRLDIPQAFLRWVSGRSLERAERSRRVLCNDGGSASYRIEGDTHRCWSAAGTFVQSIGKQRGYRRLRQAVDNRDPVLVRRRCGVHGTPYVRGVVIRSRAVQRRSHQGYAVVGVVEAETVRAAASRRNRSDLLRGLAGCRCVERSEIGAGIGGTGECRAGAWLAGTDRGGVHPDP